MAHSLEANSQPHYQAFINGSHFSHQVNNHVFIKPKSTSRHTIHVLIIPILLAFLQIQNAGNGPSSFKEHPLITMISILSILGYYFAFKAKSWLPTFASLFGTLMGVSGSVSVASLLSLLLPHSWWHLKSIFYVILVVAEMDPILKKILPCNYKHYLWRKKSAPGLLPQTYLDLSPYAITRGSIKLYSGVHVYMNNGCLGCAL